MIKIERQYFLVENPYTEKQSITVYNDYHQLVGELRRKIENYMTEHHFSEEKISDAVIIMKEALFNLLHHNPEYQPVYALIELTISDQGMCILVEDKEPGKIKIRTPKLLSETGRGYMIMNALSKVEILVNKNKRHRIAINLNP